MSVPRNKSKSGSKILVKDSPILSVNCIIPFASISSLPMEYINLSIIIELNCFIISNIGSTTYLIAFRTCIPNLTTLNKPSKILRNLKLVSSDISSFLVKA